MKRASPHKEKIQKTCAQCGKVFEAPYARAEAIKFCSNECYRLFRIGKQRWESHKITLTCVGCGKEFSVFPSVARQRFCSPECWYKDPDRRDTLYPGMSRIATCLICGKQFKVANSKIAKYCSRKCLGVANSQIQRKDPTKWQEYTCEECGKSFEGLKCVNHRKRFCSVGCRTRWRNRKYRVTSPTSIETALKDALYANGISVISEFKFGRFNIDMVIPDSKIAIEADGNYWHSLQKQKSADERKNKALADAGWLLLRFTETDINTNLAGCVESVLKIIPK